MAYLWAVLGDRIYPFAIIANKQKISKIYLCPPSRYAVKLGRTGELTIPEAARSQLNLQPGDPLTLTIETDGSLRLVSLRRQQIQKLQGIFKDIAPGVSLAEELIRERREEARRESEG